MDKFVDENTKVEPAVLIDESTLYWHIFCHCNNYERSYCGGKLAQETAEIGGAEDGGEGVKSVDQWDGGGEFCSLCAIQVNKTCPWGCKCGECRVLLPRSNRWFFWEKRKSFI